MLPQQVRSQGTPCSERSCLASGRALTGHLAVSGHTGPAGPLSWETLQREIMLDQQARSQGSGHAGPACPLSYYCRSPGEWLLHSWRYCQWRLTGVESGTVPIDRLPLRNSRKKYHNIWSIPILWEAYTVPSSGVGVWTWHDDFHVSEINN
jgi:hypothetical protein